MTEKEKKVIENIKNKINYYKEYLQNYEKNDCRTSVYKQLKKEKEDLEKVLKIIENQQSELEKKDKMIKWVKDYAQQEIDFRTEDIADYIDDGKDKNKELIGELKEEREHWKDILRIMNNEKTYMEF